MKTRVTRRVAAEFFFSGVLTAGSFIKAGSAKKSRAEVVQHVGGGRLAMGLWAVLSVESEGTAFEWADRTVRGAFFLDYRGCFRYQIKHLLPLENTIVLKNVRWFIIYRNHIGKTVVWFLSVWLPGILRVD